MNEVILTERLAKQYGSFNAVNDVSLQVLRGEIYGFLGLNGAGKTTMIRMLLGMIRPTSGAAYLKGKLINAASSTIWNQVGYMVETPYAYPDLTVRENLEAMRKLRGIVDYRSVERIIDRLQLGEYQNKKAKNLSLGNAQRLGIAKALLHEPDILILDEPSNGLDPIGIVEIRELLQGLAYEQGVTIFISSHLLGEVSKLATRIGIIHAGSLLQEVKASELEQCLRKRLLVAARDQHTAESILKLNGLPYTVNEQGIFELSRSAEVLRPDHVARLFVQAECPPTLLQVIEEDLESYFVRVIGQKGATAV
ncbi:ABC transporter ATP-binding protein [Paenibacillus sp. CF384]|uniref:ABC transporter ATP-binding protein n=1 Tax=Paenibacillus sp. CF384 TaxID=1884382 RepID=UPI00089D492B|nr:ABC transporter ATP-binding protein [Paenibacillus sp. CF384]SDX71915.1 ABC-2 type transport system ATP-binding protein [Paenibacillus sp. CF384]